MFLAKIGDYISGLIRDIGITDLTDIAIIAIFIYLILVWLKRARARFIVIGIIILGSIYALARFFHLYLTTTFFQAFLAIFLIMIVIIFQDEFRHFFEVVAIKGMVRKPRRKTPFAQEIEGIANAVAKLSRKKFGALITIRGIDPLDRHLEAGIPLDGLFNQLLLESIFDPHVPTHDGAVVIDKERIIRIGCHLPLSTNIDKVAGLGTRHTAALGLSERTDALSIIISEERGTVSIAEDGNIRQLTDIAQLNGILESFYRKRFPTRRSSVILDFLRGHSLEKIIAVIFAVGLWLALGQRSEMIRRDFVVPIEYRNLAPDIFIGEPKPKEVTLTLNGSERAFKLIDPNAIKLSPDMSGINKDGENNLLLNKNMIRLPTGVSIVHFSPEEIKLAIYRMLTLTLPIELKTQGKAAAGVAINQIRVEPKEISVIIPSTTSREKINITTEPIDLGSITKTAILTPKLIIPPDARFPADKYPEIKVIIEVGNKHKAK